MTFASKEFLIRAPSRSAAPHDDAQRGPVPAPDLAGATTTAAPSSRRPEIQGLRGLAIVLVVGFHLWGSGVSGGVDVFFVVSAYLLTRSFIGKAERGRPLALHRYWVRTFVRLLIPMALVLVSLLAVTALAYPDNRLTTVWEQLQAAGTYRLNRNLAELSVDYYAGGGTYSSPVQHMWSLAVQGQVFLLWPLLIGLALVIARVTGWPVRRVALVVFAAIFAVSLALSIATTGQAPAQAYFATRLRLWEFALGSLLALIVVRPLPARWARAAGWAGLASILLTGFWVGPQSYFPGWVALVPTGGAALILAAGGQGGTYGVGTLLRHPWLVAAGDRSYGIYLWHWPIMITYLLLSASPGVPVLVGVAIFTVSWGLAAGTDRVAAAVTSWGGRHRGSGWVELARLCALVAVVVIPAEAAIRTLDDRLAHQPAPVAEPRIYPGAAAALDPQLAQALPEVEPLPRWQDVGAQWGDPGGACAQQRRPEGFDERAECYVTGPAQDQASRTVLLVGDSHAKQLATPVRAIAEENGWRLVTYVYPGCRYSAPQEGDAQQCNAFRAAAARAGAQLAPDLVITQGTRTYASGEPERLVPGWGEGVEPFAQAGSRVISVRDNPRWERDMYECVELYGVESSVCSKPLSEAMGGAAVAQEWERLYPDHPLIDLSDLYCPHQRCTAVVGNMMVYRDLDHINAMFGRTTAPMLERRVKQALGWA